MKKIYLLLLVGVITGNIHSQTISTFEDLTLGTDTFWNGSDLTESFVSSNVTFPNQYDTAYHIWSGFIYSNKKDSITAGSLNQQSAITAAGFNSSNYSVCNDYGYAFVNITGSSKGKLVDGLYVTNATYAYISMRDGDAFAKKFGGTTGNDPDWFKLTATGFLNGIPSKKTAEIYLADYRFPDNTQDYIVRDWRWFDLLPLGNIDSVQFSLSSSDTGQFGMNTPAYFALDNFSCKDVLNVAPQAQIDDVTTTYLNDTLIHVLSNDFDTTAVPLAISILTTPQIPGAAAVISNNKILYTPAIGLVANDTILYSVCDLAGECDTAQVVIRITGINTIESNIQQSFDMYPNPSNYFVVIETSGTTSGLIIIRNIEGQTVISKETDAATTVIPTDSLASGLYLVQFVSNGSVATGKLVKR